MVRRQGAKGFKNLWYFADDDMVNYGPRCDHMCTYMVRYGPRCDCMCLYMVRCDPRCDHICPEMVRCGLRCDHICPEMVRCGLRCDRMCPEMVRGVRYGITRYLIWQGSHMHIAQIGHSRATLCPIWQLSPSHVTPCGSHVTTSILRRGGSRRLYIVRRALLLNILRAPSSL